MRKVLKISLILLLYVLLCGKSCQDEGFLLETQEEAVRTEREEIRREVEVPYLSEGDRYASEEVAMQKLAELADLVAVLTNTDLDTSFRARAGQMIRRTFRSGASTLSFLPPMAAGNEITVGEFLDEGSLAGSDVIRVFFDSIRVAEPLQRSGTAEYLGALGCLQATAGHAPGDTLTGRRDIRIEVHAVRIPKVFGSDTLRVWEVWLGNMSAPGR